MSALCVRIAGIAVQGPGLAGWAASVPVLAGAQPWTRTELAPPAPALLPATERRRTSPSVRLALATALEAVQASALAPESLASVFASSNGDGQVVGAILDALQEPQVTISPTQFHNSVHNAAAGYWGIAVGSSRPSVSLGGHDRVFATGLLHAAAQAVATREPVLFCAYDAPLPAPLSGKRRTDVPFACALVLAPAGVGEEPPPRPSPASAGEGESARSPACVAEGGCTPLLPPPRLRGRVGVGAGDEVPPRAAPLPIPSGPTLTLRFMPEAAAAEPALDHALAALRDGNPVARALPLLAALAAARRTELAFALTDDSRLEVTVLPG